MNIRFSWGCHWCVHDDSKLFQTCLKLLLFPPVCISVCEHTRQTFDTWWKLAGLYEKLKHWQLSWNCIWRSHVGKVNVFGTAIREMKTTSMKFVTKKKQQKTTRRTLTGCFLFSMSFSWWVRSNKSLPCNRRGALLEAVKMKLQLRETRTLTLFWYCVCIVFIIVC